MRILMTMAMLLALAAGVIPATAQVLVESARGPHANLITYDVQPPAGTAIVQPETGVVIRRISDLAKIEASVTLKKALGHSAYGMTNGYSRFPNVNADGSLLLGFGTTPYAVLFDGASLQSIDALRSPSEGTGKIGDLQETKWSYKDPKIIYYTIGRYLYMQDATVGPASERRVLDWGATYKHTSDGDASADGRYLAMALSNGTVRVADLWAETLTPTVIAFASPTGVDVSPSGRWVKIANYFYDRETGAAAGKNGPGHGGWAIDAGGRELFVNQDSPLGWIVGYYPDSQDYLFLQRMPGEDGTPKVAGIHVASDKRGIYRGWALVSTYGGSSPLANELYFLELKSQKRPGTKHPSRGGTLADWNAATVATADMPRIVRICDTQSQWFTWQETRTKADGTTYTVTLASYFAEHFASVNADGHVYWGGNWNRTAHLDLYRAELPATIKDFLTVGAKPTPTATPEPTATPTPTPTPTPEPERGAAIIQATQSNRCFQSNDSLAGVTLTASGAHAVTGFVGGRNGGEFDQSVLLYFPLDLPAGARVTAARIELTTTYEQGAYIANGREGAAIRAVLDPDGMGLWQPAAKDAATGKWFGASWAFHDSTSYQSGRKWSGRPTQAVWGRTGDLSTVLEPITSDTARINFPVAPGVASADITALVRRWADGGLPNRGIYLDISHLLEPVANATTRTVRVGVRGHLWSVEAERPRIYVEWETPGAPEPTPTPTPEPTATPTPTPTPEPTPTTIEVKPGQTIIIKGVQP